MWTAIGETLPLAIGLAMSPFAIVTGIILLLGRRGRLKSLLFGLGWFIAIVLLAVVALVVVEMAADASQAATEDGVDIAQLVFAALFLVLAGVTWSKRSRSGDVDPEGAEDPGRGLVARLAGMSVPGAFVMGVVQGLVVVKNLPLALGAGAVFGEAGLVGGQAVTAVAVFSFVATLGVLVPLAIAVIGGERLEPNLVRSRDWLEANMDAITLVVLLVLGALFLGQGLGVLD